MVNPKLKDKLNYLIYTGNVCWIPCQNVMNWWHYLFWAIVEWLSYFCQVRFSNIWCGPLNKGDSRISKLIMHFIIIIFYIFFSIIIFFWERILAKLSYQSHKTLGTPLWIGILVRGGIVECSDNNWVVEQPLSYVDGGIIFVFL